MTEEQHQLVTDATRAMVMQLVQAGLPPANVLAVVHAEIMALIATSYGGDVAAECATIAANSVAGLPSYADSPLAAMPHAGRA
jgi:hypothetical protein